MTHYSAPVQKLLDTPSLGARQILAVVSDPTLDRTNDVMRPEGCVLDNYRQNPIVLAVPANPGATVFARAFGNDGRVLTGEHADALERAHKRIGAGLRDMAGVLEAAGFSPTSGGKRAYGKDGRVLAGEHVLKAAGREPDDGDPDAMTDEELAYAPAWLKRARWTRDDPDAEQRQRTLLLARMGLSPDMLMPSATEKEALARQRFLDLARRGP